MHIGNLVWRDAKQIATLGHQTEFTRCLLAEAGNLTSWPAEQGSAGFCADCLLSR